MIIMASDHRGYILKEALKTFFNQENIITIDVGTYSKEPVDYPDFAHLGMDKVLENKNNVGIFICGSGIGMSIASNRNPKIRAALCLNTKMAMLARKDNDANVLCLPGNLRKKKAIAIIKIFLTTSFEGGRHARRLKKISGEIKSEAKTAEIKETKSAVKAEIKETNVNEIKSEIGATTPTARKKTSQKKVKNEENK